MSGPITNSADAVRELGALPVPMGTEPQPMSDRRLAEIRNRKLDEVTPGPWLIADGADGKPLVYVEEPLNGVVGARVLLAAEGASEADVQFVASARTSVPELVSEVERLRARVAELEAAPKTVFRASHDSIVMGFYTSREAAQEHCETVLRREMPTWDFGWGDEDDGVQDLELQVDGKFNDWSGYVVTALDVASEYDEEDDE